MRTLLTLLTAAVAASACEKKADAPAIKPAASPAAAAGPAPSRVETETYAVAFSAAAAGGTITLTARPPLHINADYPAAFKPDPGPVAFAGERVPLGQEQKTPCAAKAEDTCQSTSTVAYTGGAAGAQVSGTVLFSVCEPEKCLIEKVRVASAIR
jgi:hypothetical protein